MARVFLSHASEDAALTERIHRLLLADGNEVFLDRDAQLGITPGEEWEKRLYERLRWADVVVCVVTSAYCRSTWCTTEVALAHARGARVLPLSAEPGVRHPLLEPIQSLDATVDDDALRLRMAEILQRIDNRGGFGLPDDLSPFPGLLPFDVNRNRVFFGRERDVQRLCATLRSHAERSESAVLLVVGPSGCGKSSLVRAGLLPTMAMETDYWCLTPCTPGRDPVAAIVRELADAATRRLRLTGWSNEDVRQRLAANGLAALVDDLLLAVKGHRRTRLLLVIDQFEELLTQTSAAARAAFAELVDSALSGSLQVVATLRPEFLEPMLSSPELAALPKRVHPLELMRPESLAAVIEKPADFAGLSLDDGLVDRLVADTARGDALPLLAYTLARLAEGVPRGGRLTHARYEQLGGVQGTLGAQAEAAMDQAIAAGARNREAVLNELLRLVVVDEQGRPTRRRAVREDLPAVAAKELDQFVTQRLLTTESDNNRTLVGVAHEALMTAWAPLRAAIDTASTALRARRKVEQAADDWVARGGGTTDLWSGSQLAGAVADLGGRLRGIAVLGRRSLVVDHLDISPAAQSFLLTSMVRDRRRRTQLVAVLSSLLLLVTAGFAVAEIQRQTATAQQHIAVARQLLTQADAVRAADSRTALRLGIAAESISPGPEARSNLLDTLTHTRYARTIDVGATIVALAYAPVPLRGSTVLASGDIDGRVTLWDAADPNGPRLLGQPLQAQRGYVYDLAFTPDGHTLAVAGADTTITMWDLADPAAPRLLGTPLTDHKDVVHGVAFSPDGHTMASVDFSGHLILNDVTTAGAPVLVDMPTGHLGYVTDVAFSSDGGLLATAGFDQKVRLWDVADRRHPIALGKPMTGQTNAIWAVAFSPKKPVVACIDQNGELVLWDVSRPQAPRLLGRPLRAHTGPAYALAFAPDGSAVATVGADRAVDLWSLADPEHPVRVDGGMTAHSDRVDAVAFAPDGRTLATAGADRTTVLWDLAGSNGPTPVTGPPARSGVPLYALAISPDGRVSATGGVGTTIDVSDTTDPARPRPLGAPLEAPAEVRTLAISPDSRLLAAGTASGILVLWDLPVSGPPRRVGAATVAAGTAYSLAFSPDDRTIAIAGGDRSVSLWDVADPAHPTRIGEPAVADTGAVYSVAFSPDGRRLASGGAEGSVLLWEVSGDSGPQLVHPALIGGGAAVYAVAFSPDGRRLASGGAEGSVLQWDVATADRPTLAGPALTGDGNPVFTVGFSADSATLAGGGSGGSIALWDIADPGRSRPIGRVMPASIGSVNAVAFAGAAPWLAAGGGSGRVAVWDLSWLRDLRARFVQRACAIVGRGFDQNEWAARVSGVDYRDSCRS